MVPTRTATFQACTRRTGCMVGPIRWRSAMPSMASSTTAARSSRPTAFSYAIGYQHYWNQQWRTSLVGGQAYNMFNGNATSQLCGTAPGSQPFAGLVWLGAPEQWRGRWSDAEPELQPELVAELGQHPHGLEPASVPGNRSGSDLVPPAHGVLRAATSCLRANGARPAGVYKINDQDGYAMVLRFQKNILP